MVALPAMRFSGPVHEGRLVRRYKRFLADVELRGGRMVTAHCANPGSMLGVSRPGSTVLLTHDPRPARKLAWSLEAIRVGRIWVGIHPLRANPVVAEALLRGLVPAIGGFAALRREARWDDGGRADFRLDSPGRPPTWVEVKNVTLARGGLALFPDAPTARGRKHLRVLAAQVRAGERAVLLFAAARSDVAAVGPADGIDPEYGRLLREVRHEGVEVVAHRMRVGRAGLVLAARIRFDPGPHLDSAEALRLALEGAVPGCD
jgi:sugar fermentation stimulation protein A